MLETKLNSQSMVQVGSRPGQTLTLGGGEPLVLICGPCVIESREHSLRMAEAISVAARKAGVPLIFKSSYDKANRTSATSFRGLGIEEGLQILSEVRESFGIPLVTDVHSEREAAIAGSVVDLLQVPAFLCRQTDLLLAAGKGGKPVMVKKGQFVHPSDMAFAVNKIRSTGNDNVILCERGTCFGYRELVVDFRSLHFMAECGTPVVFDATHSVQIMGGSAGVSSGNRRFVPLLARAAIAAGVDGIFIECHDDPDHAPSDGLNMLPLSELLPLLTDLKALSEIRLITRNRI